MAAKKQQIKKTNTISTTANTQKPPKNPHNKKTIPSMTTMSLKQNTDLPIVGIGASAGGLEAFETFFKAMPTNSGLAFVLVAHLDPTHTSLLAELLQKCTEMKVLQVKDGVQVQPNAIYVIPPNKTLTILNGTLLLQDLLLPRGSNLPIDTFFCSLAQDQGPRAIGVILSGNGKDGTRGIQAIKSEFGMAMVQDVKTAKYEGMPQSAIATNLIDYVLPPEKMPEQLMAYITAMKGSAWKTPTKTSTVALQKIFELLRARTDHDFSLYKKNTLYRRIERRMLVHQIDDMATYVRYLQEDRNEIDILFKELLIGVTHFFRDPEAFEVLKNDIFPQRLINKQNKTFRIWVPGCSTGEEAYSIAILLKECMENLNCHINLQIFATDIDPDAIDAARAGVYPISISADVNPERLKRYFDKEEDVYRIKKSIREMLIFAPQNIIKDPPFSKLDLISCRNLLIYLDAELQHKLFPLFHYSLKHDGILFLGSSETIGSATDLFERIDKKWKIFKRTSQTLPTHGTLRFPPTSRERDMAHIKDDKKMCDQDLSALQLTQMVLEESNVPPSVIIDQTCNIVYVHGRTGKYLEPAPGKTNANLLEMARVGLKKELSNAIGEVRNTRKPIMRNNIKVDTNGNQVVVDILIRPIVNHPTMNGFMLVTFQTVSPGSENKQGVQPASKATPSNDLNLELQHTRESLQTTIEELETSNEELKSTNEELQSTNEELQSTNEELETSKEELQSLNEESSMVNLELQSRIDELSTAHDDMKNLLDSTQIATLFLNTDLCVHRFTPRVTDIIPLSHTDTDRPIAHFAHNLIDVDFTTSAGEVLENLTLIEREVESKNNQFYIMRVRPYRTTQNVIDGVVITFDNITDRKKMEEQLQLSELRAQAALKMLSANTMLAHTDKDLRYTWIYNPQPGFVTQNALGKRDDELTKNAGALKLLELKRSVLENGTSQTAEITFPLSSGAQKYKILAEPLKNTAKEIIGITTAATALTDK